MTLAQLTIAALSAAAITTAQPVPVVHDRPDAGLERPLYVGHRDSPDVLVYSIGPGGLLTRQSATPNRPGSRSATAQSP